MPPTDEQNRTLTALFQRPYVMRMVARRVPGGNVVAEIYDRDERLLGIATIPPDGIGSFEGRLHHHDPPPRPV